MATPPDFVPIGTGSDTIAVPADVPTNAKVFVWVSHFLGSPPGVTDSRGGSWGPIAGDNSGSSFHSCQGYQRNGGSQLLTGDSIYTGNAGQGGAIALYATALGADPIFGSPYDTYAQAPSSTSPAASLTLLGLPRTVLAIASIMDYRGDGAAPAPSASLSLTDPPNSLGGANNTATSNGVVRQFAVAASYEHHDGSGSTGPHPLTATFSGANSGSPPGFTDATGTLISFLWANPYTRLPISVAVSPTGRRLRAYVDPSGALKIDRFNDANPPAVAATVTLETSGVTGCDVIWAGRTRRGSVAEVVYCKAGTAYARRSLDGGRTWSVADTIATGYQDIAQAVDLGRGIKVVALYKESEQKWYGVVGRRNSGGTGWEYPTAPAVLVSSAQAGASLTILPDRVAEFNFRTTGNVLTTVRSKAYAVSSLGTWS